MAAPDAGIVERVRGIVVAAVAQHTGVPPGELCLEKRLRVDPGTFYRRSTVYTISIGVRIDWGMAGHRMGHYAAAPAPMPPGPSMPDQHHH